MKPIESKIYSDKEVDQVHSVEIQKVKTNFYQDAISGNEFSQK